MCVCVCVCVTGTGDGVKAACVHSGLRPIQTGLLLDFLKLRGRGKRDGGGGQLRAAPYIYPLQTDSLVGFLN